MFTLVLALSIAGNVALLRNRLKFSAKLRDAEKGTRKYKRLKSRLEHHLDTWERLDYCDNCREFAPKHKLHCPSLMVRFAITKAEQAEA